MDASGLMAWARRYKTARGETVRSRFEKTVLDDLDDRAVAYDYEPRALIWYHDGLKGLRCQTCGGTHVLKQRTYIPDAWVQPKTGAPDFLLEIKGRLTVDDRQTMEGVLREEPALDIRILFMRDNPIRPRSKTRYSDWARKAGFKYHVGAKVPEEWIGG